MKYLEIITAAVVATSAMTLFSYIVSGIFGKQYREPVLLQFVIGAIPVKLHKYPKILWSWAIHYSIGVFFVILFYIPIWSSRTNWYVLSLPSGFVAGCIFGSAGILGWRIMFRFAGGNPPTDRAGYYIHLFIAHIVFGVAIAVVHNYIFSQPSQLILI